MKLSDIMQLPIFEGIYLVAGASGINKKVKKVAVLDYEIMDDVKKHVFPEDLLLTTFTPAIGQESLIESTIRELITTQVTAIAMKKVFFPDLPQSVIKEANQAGFPIFMFDEGIYFEDIITAVALAMKAEQEDALVEKNLELLLSSSLSRHVEESLVHDLFQKPKGNNLFCYINGDYNYLLPPTSRDETLRVEHYSYKGDDLLFLSWDEENLHLSTVKSMVSHAYGANALAIGFSQLHEGREGLAQGFREAYYSAKAAHILKEKCIGFESLGSYQFLLPLYDNPWIRDYVEALLSPLFLHDQRNDDQLVETFRAYFAAKQSIKETAQDLFTHENTVRFRIKKGLSLYAESKGKLLELQIAFMYLKIRQ